MSDARVRYVCEKLGLRAMAADTTDSVRQITERHECRPTATAALGRTVTAAALLGANLKGERGTVTVRVDGGGPAGIIVGTCDGRGNLRGYIANPGADLPPTGGPKLDVAGIVGTDGYFSAAYDLGLRTPYSGSAPLLNGEIAEDLTYYLTTSEQLPSAAGLGVLVGADEHVEAAGGFLIQRVPRDSRDEEETEEALERIFQRCQEIDSVSRFIERGGAPSELIRNLVSDLPFRQVGVDEVQFHCTCSRERAGHLLQSISPEEVQEIAESSEPGVIKCEFCGAQYQFTREEMNNLAGRDDES